MSPGGMGAPGPHDLSAFEDLAIAASRVSLPLLKSVSVGTATLQVGRDIKLVEDVGSEAMVRDFLAREADLPVLGEEGGFSRQPLEGEPYWVVDPLDGSFNFARGVPMACVAVALCVGLTPLVGAIHDIDRGETLHAHRGGVLRLNGVPVPPVAPARKVLATGFPVGGDFSEAGLARVVARVKSWAKIRMIGSAALALGWTAMGRFDGYIESGTRFWDVAAGLCLAEAGGCVVTLSGTDPLGVFDVEAMRPMA